jgi:phosphatidylglycerophosphate synthase
MFDALFRQIKDRLFVSVAKMLDIPPNLITVFSLILGGLTIGFVLQKLYLAALIFWILNRIFDGLDGAIARIHQRQTDLGGYIDILSDFIIYAAIPISLVVSSPTIERYFCLTLMISTFYVNAASWMYLSAAPDEALAMSAYLCVSTTHYGTSMCCIFIPVPTCSYHQ